MRFYRLTLYIQTIYYLITAVWALVDIDSFMKVTGPKTDIWLVKTVSVLLLAICISLITALLSRTLNKSVVALAVTSCIVLIIIDCYYVWSKTIPEVYLLDAGVEFMLLILWINFLATARTDDCGRQ